MSDGKPAIVQSRHCGARMGLVWTRTHEDVIIIILCKHTPLQKSLQFFVLYVGTYIKSFFLSSIAEKCKIS